MCCRHGALVAKPIVAIVGRPNVGKSTLFNRLLGERRSIVEDEPGTTRDRVYGTADWSGSGLPSSTPAGCRTSRETSAGSHSEILRSTREHAHAAIAEADVIVFMVDARAGLNAGDHESRTSCGERTNRQFSWLTRPIVDSAARWSSSSTKPASATRSLFPPITGLVPGSARPNRRILARSRGGDRGTGGRDRPSSWQEPPPERAPGTGTLNCERRSWYNARRSGHCHCNGPGNR